MALPKDEHGLTIQDLKTLDPAKLTAVSLEVISRQATINVGTIGHVAHGKSTVVKALSGVSTIKFKSEKVRNITIKLGYANAKLFKCRNMEAVLEKRVEVQKKRKQIECENLGMPPADIEKAVAAAAELYEGRAASGTYPHGMYTAAGSHTPDEWTDAEGAEWQLERHVSFVDCPGHDSLMATMLTGAAVMDAALLLISATDACPQPQTSEHLAAIEIMGLKHIVILQNKCELKAKPEAEKHAESIREFIAGTNAEESPIIPCSAVLKYNTDIIAEYLCTQVPVPARDFMSPPQMMIIRSFDVNKPGQTIEELQGGVAGGSILRGILRVGDKIEIRPGIVKRGADGKVSKCIPLLSEVVSLQAEKNMMQYAVPGGLIGVGTNMDPSLLRQNKRVGNMLGLQTGGLPDVFVEVSISFHLMRRLIGVKSGEGKTKVAMLSVGEDLLLNIGSSSTGCTVKKVQPKEEKATLVLYNPVCANLGDKVALSRKFQGPMRLIGWGKIVKGKTCELGA